MKESNRDIWSRWILERRHGGNPKHIQTITDYLYPIRDKVLEHAEFAEGDTLLDVGCGDGLIAFGALQRTNSSRVIFSDISQDLLDRVSSIAQDINLQQRCEFLRAPADDLSAVAETSVDVVTTRSVLIYVEDKQRAFAEFFRVLKPGGRLSIFEPINRYFYPEPEHMFGPFDVTPVMELAQQVKAVFRRCQPDDTDPMLDFGERDLLEFAECAGFQQIHLELGVEIKPLDIKMDWETRLNTAPNPKAPTLREAIDESLTPTEAETFMAYLRPLAEANKGVHRLAVAYLWATKGGKAS